MCATREAWVCRVRVVRYRTRDAADRLLRALQLRAGKDPAREMIRLTTYLGHANPSNMFWYLEAVPELLDLAMMLLAVQTGLRASELVGLTCGDVVLGTGAHVRCMGKGRKERATPLRRDDSGPLFPSIRSDRLSRDAFEHLVRKHCLTASRTCPNIGTKRVTPHTLRHSTAMDLLYHRVDQAVIALWLGHASVETTQVYIHADMRIKEKALARVAVPASPTGRYRPDDQLLAFLEGL